MGFLLGVFSMWIIHKIMNNLNVKYKSERDQNIWKRNRLLIIALALHHVPESLSLGIAFGAAYVTFGVVTLAGAFSLAIGIGIHNFPEGIAASLPLRSEGMSRQKFFLGSINWNCRTYSRSCRCNTCNNHTTLSSLCLGFAAGAMIFVTINHLIPDILKSQNTIISFIFAIFGFAIMMVLELALG